MYGLPRLPRPRAVVVRQTRDALVALDPPSRVVTDNKRKHVFVTKHSLGVP